MNKIIDILDVLDVLDVKHMGQELKFLEYLKLCRLQTGATTAVAPVIGYLILASQTGYGIRLLEILIIFIIGVLMHIFEFVLNEYIDLEVDRLSPDLVEKPLVKGSVSLAGALALVIGAVIFAYILTIYFFFNIWTLLFLTLAFEFGAIYDIHGKRFAGSDFSLAFWIFFFCLFGASIVSIEFTGLLFLVAGLGFFQILFNNAIEGGLKDSDHDAVGGAHTLAHSLGVNVKDGKLIITNTFRFASYAIKLCHLSIILLIIYFVKPSVIAFNSIWNYLHLFIIVVLIFVILFTLHRFLNQVEFRRDKLKRIFSIHEIATYYLAPIILLQILGLLTAVILLFLPLIWYILLNLILYGKPLEPKV